MAATELKPRDVLSRGLRLMVASMLIVGVSLSNLGCRQSGNGLSIQSNLGASLSGSGSTSILGQTSLGFSVTPGQYVNQGQYVTQGQYVMPGQYITPSQYTPYGATTTTTQTTAAAPTNAQQFQVSVSAANTTEVYGQAYDPANISTKLQVGLYRASGANSGQLLASAMANLDANDGVTVSASGTLFRINVSSLNLQAGDQVIVRAFSPTDLSLFQTSSPVTLQSTSTSSNTVATLPATSNVTSTTAGTSTNTVSTSGLPAVGSAPDSSLALNL